MTEDEGNARLHALAEAITRFGETSGLARRRVKQLGDELTEAFRAYLGEEARVYAVPPMGKWDPATYFDQAFSYHGRHLLGVEPIKMGLAVCIPHIKDDGAMWVRIVLTFELHRNEVVVTVGDHLAVGRVQETYDAAMLTALCSGIYDFLLSIFADPVQSAVELQHGRIGFLPAG